MGYGSEGYKKLKITQYNNGLINYKSTRYNDAHNQYLDVLVKRGSVGFIGLLIIFFMPTILFLQKRNNNIVIYKCITSLLFIHIFLVAIYSFTQSFLNHNSGSIFYFFIVMVLYNILVKLKD